MIDVGSIGPTLRARADGCETGRPARRPPARRRVERAAWLTGITTSSGPCSTCWRRGSTPIPTGPTSTWAARDTPPRSRGGNPPGRGLAELGVGPGDRVATLMENRPKRCWPGGVVHAARSPSRSTPPTRASTSATNWPTPGPGPDRRGRLLVDRADRGGSRTSGAVDPGRRRRLGETTRGRAPGRGTVGRSDAGRPFRVPPDVRPPDLATFVYTGGTTGPSKGCMLSHNYHEALARQIGICWGRTADDVVWTPLPLFHFNAIVTAVLGPLVYGGRARSTGASRCRTSGRR